MPQSAWPALHLQVSVTDWSPLRTGGFTTSIPYDGKILYVNTIGVLLSHQLCSNSIRNNQLSR
nr:MAG TPA: hypothetical protein [Caudoviricetes sp.]